MTRADRSNTHITIPLSIPLGRRTADVSPDRARACDAPNLQLARLCRRYAAMLERLDGSKTFLGTAAVIYGDNRVVLLHKASKQTLFTERARCVFEGHFSLNLNGCRSCARMYVAHQLVR